jgi:hypothetical protein
MITALAYSGAKAWLQLQLSRGDIRAFPWCEVGSDSALAPEEEGRKSKNTTPAGLWIPGLPRGQEGGCGEWSQAWSLKHGTRPGPVSNVLRDYTYLGFGGYDGHEAPE